MSPLPQPARAGVLLIAAVGALVGGGATAPAADWAQPNANPQGTRAVEATAISSRSVGSLRVRWRFPLSRGSPFGSFASTPLVVGETVYAQDLSSTVYAINARSGSVRWSVLRRAPNDGPNGLATAGRRLFGATDTSVFALDRHTGRRLWARRLTNEREQFVNIAPLVVNGLVFTATIGLPPGGRGALYALDQRSGRVRWRFGVVRNPWRYPTAGGGGAWYTPSVSGDRIYYGTSNPGPWGGSPKRPNGGMYPGPVPHTDSLVALDLRTGKLDWYDQVTRHDVRDYDFEASPIVVGRSVFGAGKAGRVVAWDNRSGERLWSRAVGTHLNDLGPLPRRPTKVCPGLWGGVLSPMAYARGRLFVPVVELCMLETALHSAELRNATEGRGILAALSARSGRQIWKRRLPAPPMACATEARDVDFVPTLGGQIFGLAAADGRTLWRARARAGIIGCPVVSGRLLVVGAGLPLGPGRSVRELIAYEIPARHP